MPHYARGYCNFHYAEALRRGEFELDPCLDRCGRNRSGSSPFCRRCGNVPGHLGLPRRFWHMVIVADDVPEDEPCWLWRGTKSWDGHPINFSIANIDHNPGRLVYELTFGHEPNVLLHECHPGCINPHHLSNGDNFDAAHSRVKLANAGRRNVYEDRGRYVVRIRGPKAPNGRYPTHAVGAYDTIKEAEKGATAALRAMRGADGRRQVELRITNVRMDAEGLIHVTATGEGITHEWTAGKAPRLGRRVVAVVLPNGTLATVGPTFGALVLDA